MALVLRMRPKERVRIGSGDSAADVWAWMEQTPRGPSVRIAIEAPRCVPVNRVPRPEQEQRP